MKVCLINCLYKPYHRGGAEVLTVKTAEAFQKRGDEVVVITNGYQDQMEIVDGVKVYYLAPENIFSFIDIDQQPLWKRVIWHWRDQKNKLNAVKVEKIITQEKPDLILTHNLKGLGFLIPGVICRSQIAQVHTLHDVQLVVPSGLLIKGQENSWQVKNPYVMWYQRRNRQLFSCFKNVISPSQWLADFYQQQGFFEQGIEVLRNPINLPQQVSNKEFLGHYVYIGKVEKQKGVRELLQIFSDFYQRHPDVKLRVVGEGSLLPQLQKEFPNKDWLEFCGYIEYDDLAQKIFTWANYAILPSRCYENSPGLVYDASAQGVPVLVAEIGGAAELIQDGRNGFIFQPDDPQNLLATLERSYNSSGQYSQMSVQARAMIETYNFDKYLKELLKISTRK